MQNTNNQETLEQYLARGGKIEKLASKKIPTQKINPKSSGRVLSLYNASELYGEKESKSTEQLAQQDKQLIELAKLIKLFTKNGNYKNLVLVKQAYDKRIKELKGTTND